MKSQNEQYNIGALVAKVQNLVKGKMANDYKLENTDSNNDLIQIFIDLTKRRYSDIVLFKDRGDFSLDLHKGWHSNIRIINLFRMNYNAKDGTIKFRMDDEGFSVTSKNPDFADLHKLYFTCNQSYCKNALLDWVGENCSCANKPAECAFKEKCDFYQLICQGIDLVNKKQSH